MDYISVNIYIPQPKFDGTYIHNQNFGCEAKMPINKGDKTFLVMFNGVETPAVVLNTTETKNHKAKFLMSLELPSGFEYRFTMVLQ